MSQSRGLGLSLQSNPRSDGLDRTSRQPKQKAGNPIATAVSSWLDTLPSGILLDRSGNPVTYDAGALVNSAPKRWVVYEPMVLLPSGSFSSLPWRLLLPVLETCHLERLWQGILDRIALKTKEFITHLAINEGIPLQISAEPSVQGRDGENILRSPSGLKMLHGDFGPANPDAPLDQAFWVSTKQNGIFQTWAPRWTMFSRGNVKEKARLLSFHNQGASAGIFPQRHLTRSSLQDRWAVDLYAGIGYFAFSYARLGMKVLCWELNAYSVEGLRRGAVRNGWSVRVIAGDDLNLPTSELLRGRERIVVFSEDNGKALNRIRAVRQSGTELQALHVNCGFLPSSEQTWKPALDIVGEGWLHLHENVAEKDIEHRRDAIHDRLVAWSQTEVDGYSSIETEHVELVKTFAPDVWHCVFDVYITRPEAQ